MLAGLAVASSPAGVRVGVDILAVSDVAESVRIFGDRYVQRIFTEHEIDSCTGEPEVVAAGLAARFCAKEATIKVLAPPEGRPDWRSIEVRRHGGGACRIELSGTAADLARRAGLRELAVSLSHERGLAAAVVVARCETRTEGGSPRVNNAGVLGKEGATGTGDPFGGRAW